MTDELQCDSHFNNYLIINHFTGEMVLNVCVIFIYNTVLWLIVSNVFQFI